jgi:hypothetical protein
VSIEDRVARGAAFLDKNYPGWEQNINTETLALDDCKNCIIGQAVGSFAITCSEHKIENPSYLGFEVEGYHFLSMKSEEREMKEYQLLELAWVKLLKDRATSSLIENDDVLSSE